MKLVDDNQCGLTFDKGDYVMLADKLELMISNKDRYLECAENAYNAASKITPQTKALEIVNVIRNNYPNWA